MRAVIALLACGVLAGLAVLALPGGRGAAYRLTRGGAGITSRAPVPAVTTGEVAETARLLAAALRTGVGVVEALEVVAAAVPGGAAATLRSVAAGLRWGRPAADAWAHAEPSWHAVGRALVAADEAGLSPVHALEAAASAIDRERRAAVVDGVRRLEVLVVLPLGLAFLPGFVLTTVVPLVVVLGGHALR